MNGDKDVKVRAKLLPGRRIKTVNQDHTIAKSVLYINGNITNQPFDIWLSEGDKKRHEILKRRQKRNVEMVSSLMVFEGEKYLHLNIW